MILAAAKTASTGPSMFMFSFMMVGIVLGLYIFARVVRGKLGVGTDTLDSSSLRIVGKRPLEARKSLYVVEIGSRYILVGTAEGSVSMIDHITTEEFESMREEAELAIAARKESTAALVRRFNPLNPLNSKSEDDADEVAVAAEQKFMTIGESFNFFLGKAKGATRGRRTTTASDDSDVIEFGTTSHPEGTRVDTPETTGTKS